MNAWMYPLFSAGVRTNQNRSPDGFLGNKKGEQGSLPTPPKWLE